MTLNSGLAAVVLFGGTALAQANSNPFSVSRKKCCAA